MGCADDIPRHRTYSDHVEVRNDRYPAMADLCQHWRVGPFHHRRTILRYQDIQDVHVDVWKKTKFRGNFSESEKHLMSVSHIDNQSFAKDSR